MVVIAAWGFIYTSGGIIVTPFVGPDVTVVWVEIWLVFPQFVQSFPFYGVIFINGLEPAAAILAEAHVNVSTLFMSFMEWVCVERVADGRVVTG